MSIETKLIQDLVKILNKAPHKTEYYKELQNISKTLFLDERLSIEDIKKFRDYILLLKKTIQTGNYVEIEAFDFEKVPYDLGLQVLKDRIIFDARYLWTPYNKIKEHQRLFMEKETITEKELIEFVQKHQEMFEDMFNKYEKVVFDRDTAIERYRRESGF
jgi:hypothetical protein